MTTAALNYLKVQNFSFPKVNWKMVCFVSFSVCLILLFFYIYQIISLTKISYFNNSYEKQISAVSEENKNLEVSFAEDSFLGEVLAKSEQLNFQKTISVKYIQNTQVSDVSVALTTTKEP